MDLLHLTNPNILIEIHRMKEIMSLPKTILKESIGSSVYDNILKYVNKALKKSDFLEIEIGGTTFKRENFDSLIYILEDFNGRVSEMGETEKTLLGKLINDDDELALEFYKGFLKDIQRKNSMSEREFLEKLRKGMKKPGTELVTALNRVVGDSPQKPINVNGIFDTVKKQLDIYVNKPSSFVDTLSGVAPTKLSKRQMRKLRKVIDDKTPTLFIQDFFTLFVKSFDKVKQEIKELNAGYITDVAIAKSQQNSDKKIKEITEAYAVAITRLLNQLEIKKDGAAAEVLADAGLDSEITNLIRDGEIPFFSIFNDTWEKSGEGVGEIMGDVMKSFSGELLLTVKQLLTKGQRMEAVKSLIDPRTSVGQFMLTNQFAGLNKQYLGLIRTSAGETGGKKLKYALVYLAQSLVGYFVGWFAQSVIIFVFDILRGLIESGWNSLLDGLSDMFDTDLNNFKIDFNTIWKQGLSEWAYERVGVLFDVLRQKGEDDPNSFVGTMVNIIERLVPGGLGSVQDSMGYSIVDAFIETASQGKYDMSEFDGIIMEIVNKVRNLLPSAEIVTYKNEEDSFKSFVRDNLSEDVYNYLSAKKAGEDGGKTWYVVSRKGNGTDTYYFI